MSHDHAKKHHEHGHAHSKKKHHHHHDDGKLSASLLGIDDDYDEMTPGMNPDVPHAKKDIVCDVIVVTPRETGDSAMTELTINVGADRGITDTMDAYLIANDGTHMALTVMDVLPTSSRVMYAGLLTRSSAGTLTTMKAVINPSKK